MRIGRLASTFAANVLVEAAVSSGARPTVATLSAPRFPCTSDMLDEN